MRPLNTGRSRRRAFFECEAWALGDGISRTFTSTFTSTAAGKGMRYHTLFHFFFPFLGWLRRYNLQDLKRDSIAGFTVALVLIPQSMANAQLAGLPAYHGLYAALLPAVVGGLWGSSRHMVSGMGAVIAIMAAAALEPLPVSSPQEYIAYMALLTLLVGLLQILFGALRLGILVNFLSLPVISGFINAAAVIIAASQIGKLFGVSVEPSPSSLGTFLHTLGALWNYFHGPSMLMAALAFIVITLCARFFPKMPAVLTAVVICTFLSWAFGFENTVKVDIEHVKSHEARSLLRRVDDNERKMRQLTAAIASLEQQAGKSGLKMEEELRRQYTVKELELRLAIVREENALVRQQLRLTTFTGKLQEDGSWFFYRRKSPDISYLMASPDGERAERESAAAGAEGAAAGIAAMPGNDVIETPGAKLPAEKNEGLAWRLRMGGGALEPASLVFASGGAVVGSIPAGLPSFTLPSFSWEVIVMLFQQAIIIAFIGFAESISIAKSAARARGYRIDANQELVGQGLANISGALVMTCPVSGSFSSSAVNLAARARTGLSCVFAGLGALATLLFFTGGLYHLPQPVLAVIVLRAVGNIMHFGDFQRLLTTQWQDGAIAVITFAATLFFAPHLDYGIAIGVVLSMASYFYRSMNPRISSLSNGPGNMLRDAKVHKLAECRHIAVVHFQGPLFFGNTGLFEEYILKLLAEKKELRHIHLVCSGITSIDTSGEDSLEMVLDQAQKRGVDFSFSGVVGDVAAVLETAGVLHMVGNENVFLTPREAVCAVYSRIKHNFDCQECPFSTLFCRKREIAEGYKSYYSVPEQLFVADDSGGDPWQSGEKDQSCK